MLLQSVNCVYVDIDRRHYFILQPSPLRPENSERRENIMFSSVSLFVWRLTLQYIASQLVCLLRMYGLNSKLAVKCEKSLEGVLANRTKCAHTEFLLDKLRGLSGNGNGGASRGRPGLRYIYTFGIRSESV